MSPEERAFINRIKWKGVVKPFRPEEINARIRELHQILKDQNISISSADVIRIHEERAQMGLRSLVKPGTTLMTQENWDDLLSWVQEGE